MIFVYRTDANLLLEPGAFRTALSAMPMALQEHILRYRSPADRALRLAGRWLLKEAMADRQLPPAVCSTIYYSDMGKPALSAAGWTFSTAYAGTTAYIALSNEGVVGIDAECIRPVNIALLADYFNPEEWLRITMAAVPLNEFFRCWTAKEAVLKADGAGLRLDMRQVVLDVDEIVRLNGQSLYINYLVCAADQVVCIATSARPNPVEILDLPLT